MKHISDSQFAFSNRRLLISLFFALLSVSLALVGPGGSYGGALYRSSDGGNTWSKVPALDGISVFDIEFAPDGTTYIGTQNSVRKSTDSGLSWATLNLGIGANDQVFDVAIDPSDP